MTLTPSKMVSPSINNLTVWYGESGPIPYCLHLFGAPCRYRIPHIDHHYYNTNATSSLILSWFDWDCCSPHLNVLRKKRPVISPGNSHQDHMTGWWKVYGYSNTTFP
jgi:hypothetical protein